jgi:intracellular multiplication protein IcmE
MASLSQTLALDRIFSGAGGAGPRRLAILGTTAIVILGSIGFIMIRSHQSPLQSTVGKTPDVNSLPGGMHSNDYYQQLATGAAQTQAVTAATQGQSSVAPMPAGVPAQPETSVVAPTPAPHPVIRAVETPTAEVRPAPYRTVVEQQPAQQTVHKADDKQTELYASAIASLFAGWSGSRPPETKVILKPEDEKPPGNGGAVARGGPAPATQISGQAGASPADNAMARTRPATVLIPAGKGVYARTKLAASSDQGGPVVVTAESGPIAGDDMTGSFERRGDRLVVKLDSISLQNGAQETIDALVIAPDSMETAVASSVDQHYVARFVLPVAAAFVAGLGQAIAQSNAIVAVSPFGGYTAQNHLNFNQQLGVAAGAAGNQAQNLLLQNAPKGPTVKLDAGVNVGVIFLKPLTENSSFDR